MGIILYIGNDKNITDSIQKFSSSRNRIAVLDAGFNYRHYIEEYMPDYILLSESTDRFREISQYITDQTSSNLIITGNNKEGHILSGIPAVSCPETVEQLKKIVDVINNIYSETEAESSKFKFLRQEVISFYSIQGGVGKTTMAVNAAWQLQKKKIGKILILDLNFCEGPSDIPIRLDINGSRNIGDYINDVIGGDGDIGKSIVELNGIDIMSAPYSLYQSDSFNIDMLDGLIYSARNDYDVIIADIPFRYDNISLEMINLSTTSVLVLSQEIRFAPRILGFKKFLPENQKKIAVLNKFENSGDMAIDDLEKITGIPVCIPIPYIPSERKSLTKGDNKITGIIDLEAGVNNLLSNIF
jgi:MinD-like ATPase involved in chromosome partitioning or flagellar assembly